MDLEFTEDEKNELSGGFGVQEPVKEPAEEPVENPKEETEEPAEAAPEKAEETLDAEQLEDVLRKTGGITIPKARFDEVNGKYRAAEAELAELRAQLEAVTKPKEEPPVEIVDLEKQYMAAVLDGDEDKALEIRSQINGELLKKAEEVAERKVLTEEAKRLERLESAKFGDTVAALVKEFPVLDTETGDQEVIAEVVEWRDFYISRGDSPSVALDKAARKIAPAYMTPPAKEDESWKRKQAQMQRNADTMRRQPPANDGGVGNRTQPAAGMPESQEDWEKLPEKEREKLLA